MRFILLLTLLLCTTGGVLAKKSDSLDYKIGQMIMIGIDDRTVLTETDPLAGEISTGLLGGVVLFEKNLAKASTKDSLKLLVAEMQRRAQVPLFVSIDEEGGRVHRLKEKYGFFSMPSAAYLGRIDNEDSTLFYNRKLAALLSEIGINLNYTPSVDMAVNPDNTVIVKNERSFGSSPAIVAKHAALCIQAHREFGVRTILKHFPGHGSSAADSHLGVVDVSATWRLQELLPFEQLIRTLDPDAVMTAHIINRRWDPSLLPATLSQRSVEGLLRNLLGFKGVVFSDDLQMQAISDHYGLEETVRLALNAGVDVLMFANTSPDQKRHVTATQVHSVIRKLVRKGKVSRLRINESYRRIAALKAAGSRS